MTPLFAIKKNALIFNRFGASLGSPWAPFGLPFDSFWLLLVYLAPIFAHCGALWPLFESFYAFSGFLWASMGLFWALLGPHRQRRPNLGEIFSRSCRDFAENVPRTCQEPAKNPPYEPQAKLPFKLQVLRNDFVRRRTLSENRLLSRLGVGGGEC